MTRKLFYEDAYLDSFSSAVTGCTPEKDHWCVTLEATAFYPEGGGQPGDTGRLGGVCVLDTRGRDGEVVHITDGPLEPGAEVAGDIDWAPRFSRMQHHTGEHIVSGIIHRLYGYDNVGFHMGRDAVTIDLSGELDRKALDKVETMANEAVWRDLDVLADYPSSQALAGIEYRSKKELSGAVRIVTVPEYNVCACCGTHVRRTGEIGVIKLVNAQRYKGGMRVWLLCGDRALEDYRVKNADVFAVSALLSAKPHEITGALRHLLEERDGLKMELAGAQDRLCRLKAAAVEPGSPAVCFEDEMAPAELRRYCLALCERCEAAAVFSKNGNAWKYAAGSKAKDVRVLGKALNAAFCGKGGGKPELIQGSLDTGEAAEIEALVRDALL